MKLIFIFLTAAGCVHGKHIDKGTRKCIDMVTNERWYGDICAESSSGYEDIDPSDAHYEGAMCMARRVQACLP